MRSFLVAIAGLMLFATGAAQAKISITVDKNAQLMTVAVDGVERYQWPVSTGIPSHETPNGSFRTFRMEEDHYSKEFDDAPMPHSIFFTKIANATTLYALVEKDGVLNTTVTLTGSSQIALARNPRPRNNAVARRDTAPQDTATQYAPQYNAAGDPVVLTPQDAPLEVGPGRIGSPVQPQARAQARADDGYIYPADGSSNEARYPA